MQQATTHVQRKELGAARAKVSHLIAHEMHSRGWTQRSLGTAVGLSATVVSRVINGASHSQKILSKLAEIGVPETYLYSPYPLTQPEEK